MIWLQLLIYGSSIFFVCAFVLQGVRYSRMPMHLRWEIYPVAHEAGRPSGGSYLEDWDWRAKPRKKSLWGEICFIAREALLFEKCYRNNRGLWYFTLPLHLGLFLLMGALALLFLDELRIIAGASAPYPLLAYPARAAGVIGLGVAIFGSAGLLIKRVGDENLRAYTVPGDYFNLLFILAILVTGAAGWHFSRPPFTGFREIIQSLTTLSPPANPHPTLVLHLTFLCLFIVYIPFTVMMHMLAKYFTYHKVFWDDEPNLGYNGIASRLEKLLRQPVSWSAPHIQQGKRWSEIVSGESEVKP